MASAASLVFALILAALGARWALTGSEANARADQLGTEIDAIEQRIATMQAQQAMPEGFAPVQAFVERAVRLQDGADPGASLALVRDAAAGQVRILRVKLEEPPVAVAPPGMPAAPAPIMTTSRRSATFHIPVRSLLSTIAMESQSGLEKQKIPQKSRFLPPGGS